MRYGDITPAELEANPVWVSCQTADSGEAWYDEVYEDDYRPFSGRLGQPGDENLYVVKAKALLADGTQLPALLDFSPIKTDAVDRASAVVFASGHGIDLMPAEMGLGEAVRQRALAALGRSEEAIFPVRVTTEDPVLPIVTVLDWFTQQVEWPPGDS